VTKLFGVDWGQSTDGSFTKMMLDLNRLELRCNGGLRSEKERDALAAKIVKRRFDAHEKVRENFRRWSK